MGQDIQTSLVEQEGSIVELWQGDEASAELHGHHLAAD